jgi:hypothetical protein
MSRSGYVDDCNGWDFICWRGAVASALRGKRGQAFLVELRDALEAMPVKRLITDALAADGEFCTLGVLAARRGLDMAPIDAHCRESVSQAFDIAEAMAAEIVFENDEHPGDYESLDGTYRYVKETPEKRWTRMHAWVLSNIKAEQPSNLQDA